MICVSPISNSAASPRSHELRRSAAVSICSGVRNAHSHAMATRHPLLRSVARTVQSRAIFCLNLDCQKSGRVEGVVQYLQPSWRCQKQPCTKITALNFGKTKSGRPRMFVTCVRKRNPRQCSARRIAISGFVFLPLIAAIMRERVGWSTISVACLLAFEAEPSIHISDPCRRSRMCQKLLE